MKSIKDPNQAAFLKGLRSIEEGVLAELGSVPQSALLDHGSSGHALFCTIMWLLMFPLLCAMLAALGWRF